MQSEPPRFILKYQKRTACFILEVSGSRVLRSCASSQSAPDPRNLAPDPRNLAPGCIVSPDTEADTAEPRTRFCCLTVRTGVGTDRRPSICAEEPTVTGVGVGPRRPLPDTVDRHSGKLSHLDAELTVATT